MGGARRATGGASLAGALRQFQDSLAQHQLVWDMLDDIDQHTWVIEPKAPDDRLMMRLTSCR